ncbi:MAG TPA: helix-turn-helix domain-containing protein [Candidatus Marinimicrobia bacterium]|nr:helix-turn-helix domain-containing protein [Candidatus Neomarinimicrobiota bacterium]
MINSEFWEKVRERRQEKGLSIEDISKQTKINADIIRSIESGDFSRLPETYMRLFLKTYAKILDLEYKDLIKEAGLEIVVPDALGYVVNQANKSTDAKSHFPVKVRKKSSPLIFISAIFILAFIIFISKKVTENITESNQPTIVDTIRSDSPAHIDTNTVIESAALFSGIIKLNQTIDVNFPIDLNISAQELLSYRLTLDGQNPIEPMLNRGENRSIVINQPFEMMIYNPGKTELVINDMIVEMPRQNRLKLTVSENRKLSTAEVVR